MFKPLLISALVLVLLRAPALPAQDKPASHGIFETQREYNDFMGNVKRAGQTRPELMALVPMINDIVLLQPFGWTSKRYGSADSTLGMLADESVRRELEMIDSQYAELQQTNAEIQKQFAEELRQLDLSDINAAVERILAFREETEDKLQATLLPHQMKRLRQLAARNQLQQRSLVEIITSEPIKSDLDVSDQQARELRSIEKEITEDLHRQIAELHARAHQRLLGHLKADQRERVKEIFGDQLNHASGQRRTDGK